MEMIETRLRAVVDELIPEPHVVQLSSSPPPGWQFADDHDLWLILSVGDERFVLPILVAADEDMYEMLARVRSALQDWIAESKFGWGEDR